MQFDHQGAEDVCAYLTMRSRCTAKHVSTMERVRLGHIKHAESLMRMAEFVEDKIRDEGFDEARAREIFCDNVIDFQMDLVEVFGNWCAFLRREFTAYETYRRHLTESFGIEFQPVEEPKDDQPDNS